MQLPYSDILDIAHFSRLFDNKSECYKLFWFQAIARKIKEGQRIITFEALIDEMIADAWYMVLEYRLNLGPNDALERVVHRLGEISYMKSCEKKEVILEYLAACEDKEVMTMKRTLSRECALSFAGSFHGIYEGEGVEQIRKKSCSKNQSRTKGDVLFFTIPRSGYSNSNTGRMGGLYWTEL